MGGVFQPAPMPPELQGLDMPTPDYVQQAKDTITGLKQAGGVAHAVSTWWVSVVDGWKKVLQFIMGEIDYLLAFAVSLMTAGQGLNQPGFYAMAAAVMGDLLGNEFDPTLIQAAFSSNRRLGAMQAMGGMMYETLRSEFDPSGGTSQQLASDAPARAFLGFLIEFAVRQGNIGVLSELLPDEVNFMGGLREYGEILARNLGLGRLARRALQPLVATLVGDPLQWQLNQTYRPKLLSEGQAVKALHAGYIDRPELNRILSYQGYSDSAIEVLIADYSKPWHPSQLYALLRAGTIDDTEAVGRLVDQGIPEVTAGELWQAYKSEQKQTLVDTELQQYLHLARQGWISVAAVRDIIAGTQLTPDEYEHYNHMAGIIAEYPRKHITESEIERAFLGGIVDMTAVQNYWKDIGYTDTAIQTLSLLLLQKQSTSNRTKPGHVPHKVLSEAQAEKAYQYGLINLTQLQAYWHAMGYSADDQAVLSALVQLKTPGPGETTLPDLTTP
jgi:hypothetical protein